MARKQFLVIGAGRFGRSLAMTLHDQGHEVVIIDQDEDAIEAVMNHVTHSLVVDATDEEALEQLGVSNFDHVIVAIAGNIEASIMATVAAKSAGARRVTSKAPNSMVAKILSRVGADEVVRPEHDMGMRLAMQLATPSIVDAFKLGERHSVMEIEARHKLTGTLAELRLSNRFGVQVIAVNRGGQVEVSPKADFEVRPGDMLVVIGENKDVEKLQDFLG